MDILVEYRELEKLILEKSGTELTFSYSSTDTVKVGYPVKVMGIRNEIIVDLRVVGVEGNNIMLEYSGGGSLMNMALGMAMNMMREKIGEAVTAEQDNRISVHLDRIPKAMIVLDKFELSGISFNGSGVNLKVFVKLV